MQNRIRELRTAKHMTQVRLSIELEVSQETVCGYETGKSYPSFSVLLKMREIFGVSIDYIMGLSNQRWGDSTNLTDDEGTVLQLYRSLGPTDREKAVAYMQGMYDAFK